MTKVIAHRGFSSKYPENTLAAFQGAIECGADMIELDLQMTKDHHLVVFHDTDLDRVTNEHGVLTSFTLEELRRHDVGSWFAPEFHEERIPTLRETFDLCKGKIGINIEVKPTKDPAFIGLFEEFLETNDFSSEILISSFDVDLLAQLVQKDQSLKCAYAFIDSELHEQILARDLRTEFDHQVVRLSLFEHIDRAASLQLSDINFRWSVLNSELVDYAHQKELLVNCWTVDSKDSMIALVDMGVDGIITNFPNLLLEVLSERRK